MVHVNRNHTELSSAVVKSLLAAVALAGALGVGACGESPTAQSNKTASDASNKAARLTASAGDNRPTETLTRRVLSGEDPSKISADIHAKITRDANNDKGAYKEFLQQKPISEDLTEASKYLTASLSSGAAVPDAEFKAIVLAQTGQIANEQAQLRLAALENQLRDLANLASDIQAQATDIANLGSQANLADQRSKLGPKDLAKVIDDARSSLDQLKKDAADKAQAATAVQTDITQKRAQAQKLYDQSATDLQAADQAKGLNSIDAYNKAIAMRGRADQLAADATSLQPKLLAAVNDARVAQTLSQDAEESLRALTVAKETFALRSKGATEESTKLAAAAAKLVNDPENSDTGLSGLLTKLKAFKNLADAIDAQSDQAARYSDGAIKNFDSARGELAKYREEIQRKQDTFKANDPLLVVGRDRTPEAMMVLFKASAMYRSGEAHLINMTAASLQDLVAQSVAPAFKAAAITTDAPAGAADKLTKARDAAKTSFADAKTALDGVVGDHPMFQLADYVPARWLGFTLKAVVCNGLALSSTDSAQQQAARDEAATAAKAAVERNPALQLPGLIGAQ